MSIPALLLRLATLIPAGPAPVAELSTAELVHHEILRIDRDFGKPQWEIALDGWAQRDAAEKIEDVRLWWVNTGIDSRRKPFSYHLQRVIEFDYTRDKNGTLQVRLAGDGKEYHFTVRPSLSGGPLVYADIELADGTEVKECRCHSARLVARRTLGLPVGIGSLTVRCVDAGERPREGSVVDANAVNISS